MKQFHIVCDNCGKRIVRPDEGMVEWAEEHDLDVEPESVQVHVVHAARGDDPGCNMYCPECTRENYMDYQSEPLANFLGPDGLFRLMEWISDEESAAEKSSLVELVMRLHVEGYEEARRHLDAAVAAGVFKNGGPLAFWQGSAIEALIRLCRPAEGGIGHGRGGRDD